MPHSISDAWTMVVDSFTDLYRYSKVATLIVGGICFAVGAIVF